MCMNKYAMIYQKGLINWINWYLRVQLLRVPPGVDPKKVTYPFHPKRSSSKRSPLNKKKTYVRAHEKKNILLSVESWLVYRAPQNGLL